MILLLGSEGMAGHIILDYLKSKSYDVVGLSRKDIDIEENLNLPKKEVDYVINCIGVLGPDSDKDPKRTVFVNGYFPNYLSKYYRDTPVIHISTDCVFDGKIGNYVESDIPTETNIYGISKGLGELDNSKDLTLRVSIIGPEIKEPSKRSGLLNWVLTNSSQELTGYTKALWNGITTLELAKCIEQYLQNPVISGIYHPVNEYVSKYELLCLINEIYGLGKTILPADGPKPVDKRLLSTKPFFNVNSLRQQLTELVNII